MQTYCLECNFRKVEVREEGNEAERKKEPKYQSISLNWLKQHDKHSVLLFLRDTFLVAILDSWTICPEDRKQEKYILSVKVFPTGPPLPCASELHHQTPQQRLMKLMPKTAVTASWALYRSLNSWSAHSCLQANRPGLVHMDDKHTLLFLMPQQDQGSPGAKGGKQVKLASDYTPLAFCFILFRFLYVTRKTWKQLPKQNLWSFELVAATTT